MEKIIGDIREWFLPRKEHFDAFIKNDTRVESWFKAELLVLLSRLVKEGAVDSFEREPSSYDEEGKRSQIDFSVKIKGIEHYVELKALCISQSKGTPRNLSFYFRDDNVGLIKDFKKLDESSIRNKWLIAFIYPKPDRQKWSIVTGTLNHWKCLTKLDDYPDYLFIAMFQPMRAPLK
jgi:hypothetical protein